MSKALKSSVFRNAALASAVALIVATPAFAGECPAGKAGDNPLVGAATAPVGVMENELAAIDLSKESVKLDQRRLRFRHMEIQPGGIVPLHSHADRPALIMVNAGEIYENSTSASYQSCITPAISRANTWARNTGGRMKARRRSC